MSLCCEIIVLRPIFLCCALKLSSLIDVKGSAANVPLICHVLTQHINAETAIDS